MRMKVLTKWELSVKNILMVVVIKILESIIFDTHKKKRFKRI
jgi:hypothetical protein